MLCWSLLEIFRHFLLPTFHDYFKQNHPILNIPVLARESEADRSRRLYPHWTRLMDQMGT